jgi:hypothetical protein
MLAEWEGPADFNSMSNNVSNNAMIRQVAKGISSQSNYLEAALGERDSGMDEASGEHLYQNNDNAAVELSPAMENFRIERGNFATIYTSLQRLQKRKKMRKM